MKKLFNVKFNGNNYFENKMDAKAFRDENPGTLVTFGPDHIGSHGKAPRQRNDRKGYIRRMAE